MGNSKAFLLWEWLVLICDVELYSGSTEKGSELGDGGWREGSWGRLIRWCPQTRWVVSPGQVLSWRGGDGLAVLRRQIGLDVLISGIFWCRRVRSVGMTALSLAGRLWMGCLGRTDVGQGKEESEANLGTSPRWSQTSIHTFWSTAHSTTPKGGMRSWGLLQCWEDSFQFDKICNREQTSRSNYVQANLYLVRNRRWSIVFSLPAL